MKFCPTCGRARVGVFCSGCGFNFGSVEQAVEMVLAPAGWYSDEEVEWIKRYWDGNSWTDQIKSTKPVDALKPLRVPATTVILSETGEVTGSTESSAAGLAYGATYMPGSNCMNCGSKLPEKRATNCPLCDELL